jgi:hypothetical protein
MSISTHSKVALGNEADKMDKQIYYHFLSSENAIKNLERNRIKVSTIYTLNDPFEFMPYKKYPFQKRQEFNKVFEAVSRKWGILCFSKTWKEQLLWAHYADKHKGIALGFEIPEGELLKVTYSYNEIRTKIELRDDQNYNEQKFLELAKIKFHEWEYEKEFRLLVLLEDCEKENGFYFISFRDNLKIKEIVLGCRFKDDINKILELAKQLGVDIIATRPAWKDYLIHQCGTRTGEYWKLLHGMR